jgi:general secretion pathway protein I
MRTWSTSHPARRRGFTLLEVLVALTIIAVALTAAMRGAMALTGNSRDIDLRLYAGLVAQNQLLELRLLGSQTVPGDLDFECEQGGYTFRCIQTVAPTPNPFFRWVEIRVRDTGENPRDLADLMSLMRFSTGPN